MKKIVLIIIACGIIGALIANTYNPTKIAHEKIISQTTSIELYYGYAGHKKHSTVTLTDQVDVKNILDTISLKGKEACLCGHDAGMTFHTPPQQLSVSFCNHCFDIVTFTGNNSFETQYEMPKKLYPIIKKIMDEKLVKPEYINTLPSIINEIKRHPLESPPAESFVNWKFKLRADIAKIVFDVDNNFDMHQDSETREGYSKTTKTVIKDGRKYTVTELFYRDEPYKVKVSGGRWDFLDPINEFKDADIVKAYRESGGRFGKVGQTAEEREAAGKAHEEFNTIRNPAELNEFLRLLRKHSYRYKETSCERPYEFFGDRTLVGVGRSGGCYGHRSIHLTLKDGRKIILDGGGSSYRKYIRPAEDNQHFQGFFYNDNLNKFWDELQRARSAK